VVVDTGTSFSVTPSSLLSGSAALLFSTVLGLSERELSIFCSGFVFPNTNEVLEVDGK
jgi:hypothetical protein